jgi:regulator of sigma E protease
MESISGFLNAALPFLVVLTVLVFVHEMGHFLVARFYGVRVNVFSIGFGSEIFGWTDRTGTRWKFSLVPLGGYVKMFGDADASSKPGEAIGALSEEERRYAFHCKPLGQRTWIVAAGPIANFLFAIVLYAGLFVTLGQPYTLPQVSGVVPDSAAEAAGMEAGDLIVSINGTDIDRFEEIPMIVRPRAGEALDIVIARDGAEIALSVTPQIAEFEDNFGNTHRVGRIGITSLEVRFVERGVVDGLWYAAKETVAVTGAIFVGIGQMIAGTRSSSELGGPLLIAQMSGQLAEQGIARLIEFAALISINLGLINLFPIPVLDGGHLMFYSIEALRGRPLGERAQEFGFRIGLALVLSLMLFATWNDLVRLEVFDFLKGLIT